MRHALLRHDAAIGGAILRGVVARAGDVVTLAIALPLLVLAARGWLAGLPGDARSIVVIGAGAALAAGLGAAAARRVAHHRSDGPIAHHAQAPAQWMGHALAVAVAAVFAGGGLTLLSDAPPTLVPAAMLAGLVAGAAAPVVRERLMQWWRDRMPRFAGARDTARRAVPAAAVASALVGTALLALPADTHAASLAAGGVGLAIVVLAGPVDAATVRYMTLMGHPARSLLRRWLPIQGALAAPVAIVLLAAGRWEAGGIAALVAVGLPAITAIRILAYRAHGRIAADWVVAILLLAAGLATTLLPPLGPIVLAAGTLWIARRGSDAVWRLA